MIAQLAIKTAQVNGGTLSYVEQGAGDVVLFVHGSISDYRSWAPQLEALSSKYRVILYSRRYHYPNPWPGDETAYTVGLHADDLTGLIEALGCGPVYAVGNSFGAYTILVAATRRPDLLRKIVIGEPPILPWLKEIPGGQAIWDQFMRETWHPAARAFESGEMEQGVRLFIDGISGGPGAFDRLPDPVRQRMLDNARELAAETVSPGYFTELIPAQVSQVPLPMLLLRGEVSPRMFHLIMDRLAQAAPGARSAVVPNASHSMPSQNPPAYNQLVMDFLG